MMLEKLKTALKAKRDEFGTRPWTFEWNFKDFHVVFKNIVMPCTGNAVVYSADSPCMHFMDEPRPAIRAGGDYLGRFLSRFEKDMNRLENDERLLESMGFETMFRFQKYKLKLNSDFDFFLERVDCKSGQMKFNLFLTDFSSFNRHTKLGKARTELLDVWEGEDIVSVLAEYFKYLMSKADVWAETNEYTWAYQKFDTFRKLFPRLPEPVRMTIVETPNKGYEIHENVRCYFHFYAHPWQFDLGKNRVAEEIV